MTINPANWPQCPLTPACIAVWDFTWEQLETVLSHSSFAMDAWNTKTINRTISVRDDHKPTLNCRRWRKAVFQLTSLITSQLCRVVWRSLCLIVGVCVCGCFVCVCVCNCSSQSVNSKTQQNDKWGQGTKCYFFQGLIIGMKSSEQLNTGTEHHNRLHRFWRETSAVSWAAWYSDSNADLSLGCYRHNSY